MNPLALLDPAVSLAHSVLATTAGRLEPVLGGAAVAVSLVLVTLLVRGLLVPLSVRVARADRARRALAPTVQALRRRHASDPERLVRELQSAHRDAGTSQSAGLLPALAQAPLLMVVYRICTTPLIGGNPSVVLASNLFGAPLAQHGLAVVTSFGLVSTPALVVVTLVLMIAAVAAWASSVAVGRVREAGGTAADVLVARVMPFGTVAFAMAVPVAVSLYLLTSTAWATAERVVLMRAG